MKKNIVMVVLAAGVGKRFWPFVTDKSIFPTFGEPIIFRNIKKMAAARFSNFLVVTNEHNDATIRSLSIPGAEINTVVQKEPNGMGEALLTARTMLSGHPIVVMNAEDVVDESLYEDVARAVKRHEPFVVGKIMNEYFDGGYIRVSQNRLIDIVEKPGAGKEPSKLVKLVFDYFPLAETFIDILPKVTSSRDDQYEKALDQYAKEFRMTILSYDGIWAPLKYPWHVLDSMTYMLRSMKPGRGKKVEIKNNVILEGAVYVGNNVKIYENTKILGPAYIGDNTIIGNNNILRESVIGENSVTGFNTDIARSYVGDHCWFHSNYIGDSVLEGNVSMGSGTVLANLRLDEKEIRDTKRFKLGAMIARDVRIGVNTSVMPGTKIGTNSLIAAGLVIDQDVPKDSFCAGKTSLEIKKNTWNVTSQRATYKAKL